MQARYMPAKERSQGPALNTFSNENLERSTELKKIYIPVDTWPFMQSILPKDEKLAPHHYTHLTARRDRGTTAAVNTKTKH